MRRSLLAGLLLLVAALAQGGQVSRSTKTCGTTNFSTEVTAGCTTIKATEVDADVNTLFTAIDNLDNNNLSATAGIIGSKLASNANITGTQLSPTANILGSQLSATAGITGAQLAAGASVRGSQIGAPTPGAYSGAGNSVFCTLPSLTTHGGPVVVFVMASGNLLFTTSGTDIALLQIFGFASSPSVRVVGGTASAAPMTIPTMIGFIPAPAPGTYTVTAVVSFVGTGNAGQLLISTTQPGICGVIELA